MGARPLRRAIQRYIEDPLADEVLSRARSCRERRSLVERDGDGESEEHPLKLKLIKPRKRPPKKKPEPVGVGAKKPGEDSESDEPEASDDGSAVEGEDS